MVIIQKVLIFIKDKRKAGREGDGFYAFADLMAWGGKILGWLK